MSISFEGVGQVCATFWGSELDRGQAVKLSGPGTVALCGDGESFFGVVLCCRDDACTVQVSGFCTVGFTGTVPSAGQELLCGNGQGGVRIAGEDEQGTECLVADVDAAGKTVTILL